MSLPHLPVAALALALAIPRPAEAAHSTGPADDRVTTSPTDIQGDGDRDDDRPTLRLSIDTDLLGYTHFSPDDDNTTLATTNALGFGLGRLSLIDTGGGPLVLDRSLLAVGLGAVILDGRAVVGGRVAFVVDGLLREGGDETIVAGRFVPYFNWMFRQYGRLRPFVGVRFGLGGGAHTTQAVVLDEELEVRTNTIYPIVGAQGGAYVFLLDRVSVDLGLSLDYVAPFGRTVQVEPEPEGDQPDYEQLGNAVNLAVTLGLSAWF